MARSREQNREMREERQAKILSAAVKLFATQGLAATKVTDVAKAAGMSQGLLYHYFPSKEAMFVEIVRSAFEKMNTAARALEEAPLPPAEKIRLAAARILKDLEESEDFAWFSTLISLASVSDAVPPEARDIILRERDLPYRIIASIARAGQEEGSVVKHKPEDQALVFWTAIKGLALHRIALGEAYFSPEPGVLTGIFFNEDDK